MSNSEPIELTNLTALLEAEKQMLLNGELDALGAMGAQKEAIFAQLSTGKIAMTAPQGEALRRQVQENGHLYEATLKGLRRASNRLRDVTSVLSELKTYNGQGSIRSEGLGGPTVSFKA